MGRAKKNPTQPPNVENNTNEESTFMTGMGAITQQLTSLTQAITQQRKLFNIISI
jgi:hypothetical protein